MSAASLTEAELTARPLRVAAAPVHSLLMALRDAAGAERGSSCATARTGGCSCAGRAGATR